MARTKNDGLDDKDHVFRFYVSRKGNVTVDDVLSALIVDAKRSSIKRWLGSWNGHEPAIPAKSIEFCKQSEFGRTLLARAQKRVDAGRGTLSTTWDSMKGKKSDTKRVGTVRRRHAEHSNSDRLDQEYGPHTKELRRIEAEIETEELSKPLSPAVEQERTLRMIGLRRGRDKFRKKLVRKYGGRCPITGCNALPALEAAHIRPYSTSQSNQPDNGLLLRADIHTLFDLDLIGIEPTNFKVAVAPQLKGTEYEEFEGKRISYKLDLEAVQERWDDFCGN